MCLRRVLLAVLALAVSVPAAAAGEDRVAAEHWRRCRRGRRVSRRRRPDVGAIAGNFTHRRKGQCADTSTDLEHFKADAATLGFDHFFGPVGLNLDLRWWDQQDLFSSTTFGASLYYKHAHWRISLRGEARNSDLDEFGFDTVVPIRGVLVPISGVGHMQPRQYRPWSRLESHRQGVELP